MSASAYLRFSVFVGGFSVMAAEMAAPRLLAPFFGSSQIVWTNVIGSILAALTAGAFVGGRLADRYPSETAFARVLLAAGLLIGTIPWWSRALLHESSRAFAAGEMATVALSLLATCAFFAPPAFLLGMILPWSFRLAASGRQDLGRVAGRLSGWSAAGSILGTFLGSFVLLPLLGTRATLVVLGACLVLTGCWRGVRVDRIASIALFGVIALATPLRSAIHPQAERVLEQESLYHYIGVDVDRAGWTRLRLDDGVGEHSILPPRGVRTLGVWDAMSAAPALFAPSRDPLRVLILGLGAGTLAWQLEKLYAADRELRVVGVELDPEVLGVGRRFFAMSELDHLVAHSGDARRVLQGLDGSFDLVVLDAYRGNAIPFHLATHEFFLACQARLAPGGVLLANLAAPENALALQAALASTLRSVFAETVRVSFDSGHGFTNTLFLASREVLPTPDVARVPTEIGWVVPRMLRTWEGIDDREGGQVLRDDRAPVELLATLSILRSLFPGKS